MNRHNALARYALLTLLIGATSCGPLGNRERSQAQTQPEPTKNQPGAAKTEPSPRASQLVANENTNEDPVLGRVPQWSPQSAEVESAVFSFKLGGTYRDAKQLAAIALEYVEKTDENVRTPRTRVFVTFLVDNEDLAEVVIGSGIGRPCWTVKISKSLEIKSCEKGIGKG
jgi:hypothetical protein